MQRFSIITKHKKIYKFW